MEREATKTPHSRIDISRKMPPDRFNGGNGRNIGLGLIAKQGLAPERPEAAFIGAEVPCAAESESGANAKDFVLNRSASQDGGASTEESRRKKVDHFASKTSNSSLSKMLRSRSSKLLLEDGEEEGEENRARAPSPDSAETPRSPLQRRMSLKTIIQHNRTSDDLNKLEAIGEDQEEVDSSSVNRRGSLAAAAGAMASTVRKVFNGKTAKIDPAAGGETAEPSTSSTSVPKDNVAKKEAKAQLLRRDSQFQYADSSQTAIVFDWDDTLFPTSYLIDDLRLNHKKCLKEQRLPKMLYEEVAEGLQELEMCVVALLKLAHRRGKVILVTLAKNPWVEDSCNVFFSSVGELIKDLGIKVVYAQEGVTVDYDKRRMMCDEEVERFYAEMKGKAISREVDAFYTQYEGQSWKNIISIGDSDFERLGTMMMTQEYMRRRGLLQNGGEGKNFEVQVASAEAIARNSRTIEKDGQVYKVRTKTFKMLDCPTIGELKEEISLLLRWLPKMVELDDGFDADLCVLDDPALVEQIERVLSALPGKRNGRKK